MRSHVVISALFMTCGVLMNAGGPAEFEHIVAHFSIMLPAGYQLKDVSPPGMDFLVYRVSTAGDDGRSLVLYFGNNPTFPQFVWGKTAISTSKNSINYIIHPYDKVKMRMEGVLAFQGLTYRDGRQTPFSKIHYFNADKINKIKAVEFEKIVNSIKVVNSSLN